MLASEGEPMRDREVVVPSATDRSLMRIRMAFDLTPVCSKQGQTMREEVQGLGRPVSHSRRHVTTIRK